MELKSGLQKRIYLISCGDINRHVIKRILNYIVKLKKPENINSYPEDGMIGDIKVIYTPGHTVGHVCLLYKDIMFVGDLFRTKNGEIIIGTIIC